MTQSNTLAPVRIRKKRFITSAICEFRLASIDGERLDPFTPGAHITIKTPSGAMRRYSLINDGNNPTEYVIAVKRENQSRGGSTSMHDETSEDDVLYIDQPESSFALVDAGGYLLIAGGIGITPIYGMAQYLSKRNADFFLIYCTKSPQETAYLTEITHAFQGNVLLHHDYGDPSKVYDFWKVLETPDKRHIYCCGPKPLMEEVKAMSGHWNESQIHFEDFKPAQVVHADDKPFDVTVTNTGQTIHVPADRSILEALRDADVATVSSCESGTCGTCRCRLVAGEVDHRDMVLTDEQKQKYIQICISRARSDHLVIEL